MESLRKLYIEIAAIDAELRELNASIKTLTKIEKMSLEVCKIDGFSEKLMAKVNNTFQNQVENLEEKKLELNDIWKNLIMLSSEEPKSATFFEDLQRVIEFCSNLEFYLRSPYSFTSPLPVLDLISEMAITRLITDISIINKIII